MPAFIKGTVCFLRGGKKGKGKQLIHIFSFKMAHMHMDFMYNFMS